ncbi:MAG: O-antigen ligase family protein [Gemmatimonadetes bacterium]|nr:O-antigen ligase family protein [Gemmatimonadota bacterium]
MRMGEAEWRGRKSGAKRTWTAGPSRRRMSLPAGTLLGLALLAAASAALVQQPLLTAGILLGAALVSATLLWPLVVVGVMLALGPLDVSFITGGQKELFPELGGLDMSGIRLVGVVAGLSAVALSDRSVLRRAVGRYGRLFVVFLVYAAGTIVFSQSPVDGLRLLFKLAYPFLLFVVVLAVARSREEVNRLADWVLVGAVAVIVVLTPLYVAGGAYLTDIEGRVRIASGALHPNPFSFYLVMMMFVAVVRFALRRQVRYLVLGLASVAWMVLTLTRIAFLGAVVGLAGMAVYAVIAHRNWRMAAGAGALAVVVVVAFTPVVLERTFGYVLSAEELLDLLRNPIYLYGRINWQGRELFWPMIFQAFTTSPMFGLGLGSTTAMLTANFPRESGLVVHNEYLRLLAETGLVGSGLFALAVMGWGIAIVRAGAARSPVVWEFALPALGGLLAWAVIAITDNPFDYYAPFTQFIGFLVAGALVTAELEERERAAGDGRASVVAMSWTEEPAAAPAG